MAHLIRCSSFLLGLTLCVAAQAQEAWFPLSEGKRLTFQAKTTTRAAVVQTSKEGTVTATVVRREKLGDQEWFRIEWRDDREELSGVHWVRSDAQGVQLARASDDHLWLVPAALTPGTTVAETRVQAGNTTLALKEIKVGQPEKVAAPIGEREALCAESRVEAPAARRVLQVWYSRGLGPVKIVETVEAPATRVERVLLLTKVEDGAVGMPVEEPETPAQPARTPPAAKSDAAKSDAKGAGAAPGALVERARALIAGKDGEWEGLETAARVTLIEANRAQPEVPTATPWAGAKVRVKGDVGLEDVKDSRVTSGAALSILSNVRRSVIVVEGTLTVSGNLTDCLVIVIGDVVLQGNLHDCLLLVSGTISVQGNMHDAAVAADSMQVMGNVHDALLQARSLQAMGNLHDDVLIGVASPGGKNNRQVGSPDLWAHFAK